MAMDHDTKTSGRNFLTGAAGAAIAATVPAAAHTAARSYTAAAVSKSKRPLNVLSFMSDDIRTELASFNYCQFRLCKPSRFSLFTGDLPRETGVLGNNTAVVKQHPGWTTLPRLFREHGYTFVNAYSYPA
jgi:iduronate 2-sulfatase